MYSVVGPECNLYVSPFEQVGDVRGFFAYVGERGPFLCRGVCVCGNVLCSVGGLFLVGRGFMLDREGIAV